MRKLKKGFTIVELIIVIAVMAVLAAVLVPTFVHLSKKAKEASDSSLVANLNTALSMEQGETGKAPRTMHEAVEGLENQGYKLPQLVTKSNQELVYSIDENKFYLSDDKSLQGKNKFNYWHIQSKLSENQEWSVYAYNWTGSASIENLTVGFDAGNEYLTSISYNRATAENKRTVVIRTNGVETTLHVNAPLDTVHHYDYLDGLNITAVAGASYHEHGVVKGTATISSGHIEIDNNAQVSEVFVKNATDDVKVTANSSTIVVVDSTSSSQTNVVANSEDVYVSGLSDEKISGSNKTDVVKATGINSYATLNAAVNAGGFYYVSQNFNLGSVIYAPEGKKTVLDFAGKTITYTGDWLYKNSGELTILDSGTNGGIDCRKGAFDNLASGVITINGGKITASLRSGSTIRNGNSSSTSKLFINNVTVESYNNYAVWNGAYCEINNGSFTSYSSSAYSPNYGYCIASAKTGAELVINGGTVSAIHGAISVSAGAAVINNVHASTAENDQYSFYALYVAGEAGQASATINGGTFIGGRIYAAHIGNSNKNGDGGIGAIACVNIHGGTFKGHGSNAALEVSFSADGFGVGQAFISAGTFSSQPASQYILPGSSVNQNSAGEWVVSK